MQQKICIYKYTLPFSFTYCKISYILISVVIKLANYEERFARALIFEIA